MEKRIENNDKLYYRFIEFTCRLVNIDLPHETFKLIALDQYTVQSKTEIKVKRLSDSFRYMINNLSSDITLDFLNTSYYLLTGKKINKETAKKLLYDYYHRFDDHAHKKATDVFISVISSNIKQKTEFAFVMMNYILIKRGYYPVIIYPADKKIYLDAVKSIKSNPNQIYLLIVQLEHFIRKSHAHKALNKSEQKSKEEVINFFKNESETLKKKYHVKHLYLYGSYCKDSNIATSDIDILIVLNDYLINYEKTEVLRSIRKYLFDVLDYKIDVMEFSHALSSLEIHEMTHIITIF